MCDYLQLWKVGFNGLNGSSLSGGLKVNHGKMMTSLPSCCPVADSSDVTVTGAKIEKCAQVESNVTCITGFSPKGFQTFLPTQSCGKWEKSMLGQRAELGLNFLMSGRISMFCMDEKLCLDNSESCFVV